ncbi:MAG: S8 family serine peptidase [Candidatus Thorarchaeota archaeon]
MNNLKKAGVMALVALFTISMVLVPFTPMTQIQPVAAPNNTTPEEVLMDIQRYVDTQKDGGPLGSILASYRDTGYIPNTVSVNSDGGMGLLVTVRSDSDVASLDEIIDVSWKVEVGAMTIASGFVNSPEAVGALENFDGIVTAFADSLSRERTTGVEPRPVASEAPPISEPDAYAIIPEIGADQAWAAGYDGTGTTVAVHDTGVDFGHPELAGTMDIGADGLSTNFDGTGEGFVISLYRANATNVNATAYLAYSSWNVLSYKDEATGKYYINWTTTHKGPLARDVKVNNGGSYTDLDWFISAYLGAWWGNQYPNQSNLTDYYLNTIRADPEIPDPSLTQGGPTLNITMNSTSGAWELVPYYTTGYAMQQRQSPYMKVFAPVLVLNGSKIIVDWNTTRAHTDFWNLNINYGMYDFNESSTIAYYDSLIDSSFVDDWEAGLYYTADGTEEHLNLYYDYPDGAGRFSLGTLAHTWEMIIFGLGMVDGIGLSGRALSIVFDGDDHGTFVAGEIAGQGITSYPVGTNGTLHALPGIAPGAKLQAIIELGISHSFTGMLWSAGFDLNYTSGYWEWNGESDHQAQIQSNSWGWVMPQYGELEGQYSLVYAALATPGFFNATHYPGMVICFSAGNSGPGYGTATPPSAPQMMVVGASTSYHTFNDAYGPDQGFDQIADFSSRGPMSFGYPKPDVLAPGRNNYGLQAHNDAVILGINDPYSVAAGTSMACPLVAGLAALMLDADNSLTPDGVKTIIQSTADDTGMDGQSQGHGVINAWAAIDYIVNGVGNTFYTYDSITNWGTFAAEAWMDDMYPYTVGGTFSNTSTPPGNFADGNLYFGLVTDSDVATISVEGDFGTYTDWTWTDARYVADQVTTFTFETSIYNETTSTGSDDTKGGYIVLNTAMEAASAGSYGNFGSADYATISISGDQATFTGGNLWAFVFDWIDNDPNNGVPDYYNETLDTGDELTRWQADFPSENVMKMDLAYPGGLSNLFPNNAIVMIHDDTIWDWPYVGGNMLDVTVTTWTLVDDPNIVVSEDAGEADVDLTVLAGTDYGIHQGFVIATNATDSTMVYKIPYTYDVYATYDTEGTVMEIAEGIGDVQTPYEHGTVTAGWDSAYTAQSADHISFVVDLTDATVNYLAARINWTNADTDIDVGIIDSTGFEIAHSGDAGAKLTADSSLAIADVSGETGMYIIYTSTNSLEGPVPETFTLSVVGLASINEPTLEISWTARDHPTPTVVTTGGSAIGDHVMVKAAWTDGVNPGMPEFGITSIQMSILYGILFEASGACPQGVPDPSGALRESPVNPDYYAWETATGITEGDNVRIVVDFDGADVDALVWWADTDPADLSMANSIAGNAMATGDHPQVYTFDADRDGDLLFAILDWQQDGSHYELSVDTRLGLDEDRVSGGEMEMDSYYLLANQSYSVLVDSDTGTNLRYSVEVPNIFLGNYFLPDVNVVSVTDLGAGLHNFTWTCTDLNADDTNFFSIGLSSDDGVSYQVLARNVTDFFYVWDSSGYLEGDYSLRVRAFSVDLTTTIPEIGWPSDPIFEEEYCLQHRLLHRLLHLHRLPHLHQLHPHHSIHYSLD